MSSGEAGRLTTWANNDGSVDFCGPDGCIIARVVPEMDRGAPVAGARALVKEIVERSRRMPSLLAVVEAAEKALLWKDGEKATWTGKGPATYEARVFDTDGVDAWDALREALRAARKEMGS